MKEASYDQGNGYFSQRKAFGKRWYIFHCTYTPCLAVQLYLHFVVAENKIFFAALGLFVIIFALECYIKKVEVHSPMASSKENRTTFPSFWKSTARFAIHLNPVSVSYTDKKNQVALMPNICFFVSKIQGLRFL